MIMNWLSELLATSRLTSPDQSSNQHDYTPSTIDVMRVRNTLFEWGLPVEIIDLIIDLAEYWPRTTQMMERQDSSLNIWSDRDTLLLRCWPLALETPKSWPSSNKYGSSPLPQASRRLIHSEYNSSDFYQCMSGSSKRDLRQLDHPCKRIVFTITSQDQGWASEAEAEPHPYSNSYTWFEVGLERFERDYDQSHGGGGNQCSDLRTQLQNGPDLSRLRPIIPALEVVDTSENEPVSLDSTTATVTYQYPFNLLPDECLKIQCNKRTCRDPTTHVVVWSADDNILPNSVAADELAKQGRGRGTGDGKFVRSLKAGDVVTVWGKARFRGWKNEVHSVKVDIYWAV